MNAILRTAPEYAQLLRGTYPKDRWTQAVFEAAQAHPEVPAAYWAEVLAEMPKWYAGDRTYRVEWFNPHLYGNARHCEEEFLHEHEAMAKVRQVLQQHGVTQATVTKWTHSFNLPGALPRVKANVCSMTVYKLDDFEDLIEKPVDIFGTSY